MRSPHELIRDAIAQDAPSGSSRRTLLRGGTLAVSALAVAPVIAGLDGVMAAPEAEGRKGNNRGGQGDTAVLNYALTLEHLEYAFYRDGLNSFSAGDFDPGVFERLEEIRDHEDVHVDTLIDVIRQRGGKPVAEACYDFGDAFSDPAAFLGLAQVFENTGVMAYDGAIATIKNPDLQTAGATIATVEARHAAYLNILNGDSPFPDAFDTPKTKNQILKLVTPFIVPC